MKQINSYEKFRTRTQRPNEIGFSNEWRQFSFKLNRKHYWNLNSRLRQIQCGVSGGEETKAAECMCVLSRVRGVRGWKRGVGAPRAATSLYSRSPDTPRFPAGAPSRFRNYTPACRARVPATCSPQSARHWRHPAFLLELHW